jgi:DtxR family Mn-dependent transcriptional regulator
MSPHTYWLAIAALVVAAYLIWRFRTRLAPSTHRRRQAVRIEFEDTLKHLYQCEAGRQTASPESISGRLGVSVDRAAEILSRMREKGLVQLDPPHVRLTGEGRQYALHVIRAHRLWERYLADQTGMAETDWHDQAERLEHQLSREEADQLAARLGHPTHDPHGDPVPSAKGRYPSQEGEPLSGLHTGDTARVVHVEDEPPSVYARVVAEGLYPGMEFRVIEADADGLVVRSEGRDRKLDLQAAGNITVRQVESLDEEPYLGASRLSELPLGRSGRVTQVSRAVRAVERRRFLDLGILPGTIVRPELAAPGGDPVAYRIRGALIALRKEQADHIFVVPTEGEAA